jgi:hypothetical protein
VNYRNSLLVCQADLSPMTFKTCDLPAYIAFLFLVVIIIPDE